MSVGSVLNFVDAIRQNRVLEPDKLDELSRLQPSFPDPRQLAKHLLQRGWLTPYQINQLMAGRGSDLSLGQYVVLERLGEGGMGQVFKARHRRMDRTVAIKVIRKDHLNSQDAVKRFRREMQATASLSHPNIVTALDADQVGDQHFFVMEYVEGIDLGSLIKRMGPPPVAQACDYMRQAALGLQHASEKGMVHRDIKPSNLLVSRPAEGSVWGNTVKILDMGVARIQDTGDGIDSLSALTKEGRVVGTPDFMAPEQAANSTKADIRSDLYSLGCTFFTLLTGQAPFPGGTPMEKLLKHRIETPKPVDKLRPEVPPGVVAVVQRLMAKKPEDRFQTPAELVKALDVILTSKGLNHVPPSTMPAPAPATMRRIPVDFARLSAPGSKRWLIFLGAALVMLLGLILLIYALISMGSRKPTMRADGGVEEPANPVLRELNARASDPKTNLDALRRDLLHFRLEQAGTPESLEAARIMARLPSALDDLKHESIPAAQAAGLSPEVVAVLGDRRQRHWGAARAIAVSQSLGLVASAGQDQVIRLWDSTNLQERNTLPGHNGSVQLLEFLPDGQTLFSFGSDNVVRFWDGLTGAKPRERNRLQFQGRVDAVALAADGKTFAYSSPATGNPNGPWVVRLVEIDRDGKEPRQRGMLTRHSRPVRALAFSSDSQSLASSGDDALVVWDLTVAPPKEARVIPSESQFSATTVAFSRDGGVQLLASGGYQIINVYDLSKPETPDPTALKGHQGRVTALAFVPGERRLVSAGEERMLRLWDLSGGGGSSQSARSVNWFAALAFAGTPPRLYTAGHEGTVRQWLLTPQLREMPPPAAEPLGAVTALVLSPDGKTLLSANDGDAPVRQWSLGREIKATALSNQTHTGFYMAQALDGQTVAVCGVFSNRVTLYRLGDAGAYTPLELPPQNPQSPQRILSLAISPDAKTVATGNPDGTVRLHTVGISKGPQWRVLTGHNSPVVALAFSPDGKLLASSDERTLRHWDVEAGKELPPVQNESGAVALAFGPDGKTLAAGIQGDIRLYDVMGAQLRLRATPRWARSHAKPIAGLAYSPDGGRIASVGQDGELLVMSTASGSLVYHSRLGGSVRTVAYAADGRHLATANGNGTIYIFRVK
jgi:serine/threonine-protein kinase